MRLDLWSMTRELNRHQTQEAEANRFTIELLMPPRWLQQCLQAEPKFDQVLFAARVFDVSREAVARRYADRLDAAIARKEC